MINGYGKVLAYNDSNISYNNHNINNFNYDDSFSKMLNENIGEELSIDSSNVSNEVIEKDTNYNDYDSYDNASIEYNNIEHNSNEEKEIIIENKEDKNTNFKEEIISDETSKSIEKKVNSKEDIKNNNIEEKNDNIKIVDIQNNDKLVKNYDSKKEKFTLFREKFRILLNNINNKAIEKKDNINKKEADIINKDNKKENIKNNNEIENIKKQLKYFINNNEFDEDDKKEFYDLIESLELIKNKINDDNEKIIKELIEIKELIDINMEIEELNDNIEIKELNINDKKEDKELKSNKIVSKDFEEIEYVDISNIDTPMIEIKTENKYIDKYDNLEKNVKTVGNNTISDEKGTELTIVNMKDSLDGANIRGSSQHNNVNKVHNNNITESVIKFQELMGKLVNKAQIAINNGKSEVLMNLNPEYLGKVRLKISMDGDNLIGKIFVDNIDVKDIFIKNLDTVISSLNEIGVNIEGFDVMLRQDMPNDGDFEEQLNNLGNRVDLDNNENMIEKEENNIKSYIVPYRKLNLLI